MTIRHLRIFVAVCEEGGITRASEKLFLAQPTVSFAVGELEKHYGVKLFDRISRRLSLTDAGRRLLPYARHITAMFEEMEEGVRDWEAMGTLRVGTSITIGNCLLPELLEGLSRRWPQLETRIRIDNSEKIEQAVLDNQIDLGLIEGLAHSGQLVAEPFRDDELALLCAAGHRWAQRASIRAAELREEPFLMRERGSGGREILESALLLHGIELEPAWESISTQAILNAVAMGSGVAVLPLLLAEGYLNQRKLVAVEVEGISLKRTFTMIHHKNKYLTGAALEFMNLCRAGYG